MTSGPVFRAALRFGRWSAKLPVAMDAVEHFAAMISGLRRAGLSLPEIAKQSGIGRTTIWKGATGQLRPAELRLRRQNSRHSSKGGPQPTRMVRR